jgi:hypothetical protein
MKMGHTASCKAQGEEQLGMEKDVGNSRTAQCNQSRASVRWRPCACAGAAFAQTGRASELCRVRYGRDFINRAGAR